MGRLWSEFDLHRERQAEDTRTHAMALFKAAAAVLGGKEGVKSLNDWMKNLG